MSAEEKINKKERVKTENGRQKETKRKGRRRGRHKSEREKGISRDERVMRRKDEILIKLQQLGISKKTKNNRQEKMKRNKGEQEQKCRKYINGGWRTNDTTKWQNKTKQDTMKLNTGMRKHMQNASNTHSLSHPSQTISSLTSAFIFNKNPHVSSLPFPFPSFFFSLRLRSPFLSSSTIFASLLTCLPPMPYLSKSYHLLLALSVSFSTFTPCPLSPSLSSPVVSPSLRTYPLPWSNFFNTLPPVTVLPISLCSLIPFPLIHFPITTILP